MTYLHINQQLASEPPVDMTRLLDAGNVADGAAGGAGGEGGVGLEGLRDFAGAVGGLPCGGALRLGRFTLRLRSYSIGVGGATGP
jgi:hypothetical protein